MNAPDAGVEEFGSGYAAEQLRRSRHPLRRLIKARYLNSVLREVEGPTIDFGCGAGQLLERLPSGSIGLETNPHLIEELKRRGLDVIAYDGSDDDFSLSSLPQGRYTTFVMSHVLEHFEHADSVLRKLLAGANRLGVRRFIVIVPGSKGYRSDATHKTYVDRAYLERQGLLQAEGYELESTRHFPIDWPPIGEVFIFHEFIAVYVRRDVRPPAPPAVASA